MSQMGHHCSVVKSTWLPLLLLLLLLLLSVLLSWPYAEAQPEEEQEIKEYVLFRDRQASVRERAEDIVGRLTLREKVGQLSNTAAAVERLGIGAYQWWSECLHGWAPNGPGVNFTAGPIGAATTFPQVTTASAAFNDSAWRAVARAVAVEGRALFNAGQAGLTCWAPFANVLRDPRWGRAQEAPGEDPLVAARFSSVFAATLQQDEDPRSSSGSSGLMLSACCKHLVAYDLENWHGFNRYTFNALVTQQDLEDTFLPPFQSCVQGANASCVMCSYNQINGVPACAHTDLLTQKVRGDWGFQGYVTSDCDAVAIIHENQSYAATPEDAVADVLKAGMDINCGTYLLRHTLSAVEKGKIEESTIDRALINLFSVRIRLGLFDEDKRYKNLGAYNVCTDEHRQLSLDVARQGIVLLKNRGNSLPLSKSRIASLAVIGPNADNPTEIVGDYSGVPCQVMTPRAGLSGYVPNTMYFPGCHFVNCTSKAGFDAAKNIAAKSDAVVLILGLDSTQEREDHDRVDLNLPGQQKSLVSEIAAVSRGPVVLVIMGGGPVDVSFAVEDSRVSAVLWIGYPGEAGGQALAEIIFGDYNPAGRLPMTWYPQDFTKVPMNIMNMRPDPSTGYPGRTYRFYTGKTVFPFGYGLSYSNFSHKIASSVDRIMMMIPNSNKEVNSFTEADGNINLVGRPKQTEVCERTKFSIEVIVYNHGPRDGDHVVLLYVKTPAKHKGAPLKQLIGFDRVHVKCNESVRVEFSVEPCEHLITVTEDGRRVISAGQHIFTTAELGIPLTVTLQTSWREVR